jgi:hypothetical protein
VRGAAASGSAAPTATKGDAGPAAADRPHAGTHNIEARRTLACQEARLRTACDVSKEYKKGPFQTPFDFRYSGRAREFITM